MNIAEITKERHLTEEEFLSLREAFLQECKNQNKPEGLYDLEYHPETYSLGPLGYPACELRFGPDSLYILGSSLSGTLEESVRKLISKADTLYHIFQEVLGPK